MAFAGGHIDRVDGGIVSGWMFSEDANAAPHVTVNGIPATIENAGVPRPDVEAALGLSGAFGFHARIGMSVHGEADIALHAAEFERLRLVCRRTLPVCHTDGTSPLDLEAAIRISRQPGAVAVVVWDAAHNPAGRAKVLYDIVASRRPAVLFGFCHAEFGGALWPPLRSAAVRACLVRPDEFERFRAEARAARLQFDTIWLCKPRLPTFALAEVLAHPGTALVLDIDDEEEAFSRTGKARDRWYGATSANKAALYRDRLTVRSVASVSLQARYGGELVRHVRAPSCPPGTRSEGAVLRRPRPRRGAPFRLVFIGTVRPHKGLIEAARAVRLAAYRYGLDVTLTVGGVFDPPELAGELSALGVETMGMVSLDRLHEVLTGFDAVLTGYPSGAAFDEINTFQVSSKIGDALAAGLPVLVPRSPSVADLESVAGVTLFDAGDFGAALRRVVTLKGRRPALPASFTVDHAHETFLRLEAAARPLHRAAAQPVAAPPERLANVVLLWKQEDAGLYGRRVDQVARTLREQLPRTSVHVLEFVPPATFASATAGTMHTSQNGLCVAELARKLDGSDIGGVSYRSLFAIDPPTDAATRPSWTPEFAPAEVLQRYFHNHDIFPGNSVVVVFPLVKGIDALIPFLARFPLVADIVDNQLRWSTPEKRPGQIAQYRKVADIAKWVVFNSANNRDFMVRDGLVDAEKAGLIPNWYTPPSSPRRAVEARPLAGAFDLPGVDVLYSGNMNGRIDWVLMREAAREIAAAGGRLHLVGAAQDALEPLAEILAYQRSCIYHGVMREADLVAFASACDFAIVPHLADALSSYMNPIKVRMYEAIGLPHIATDVAGIDVDGRTITVTATHKGFVAAIRSHIAESGRRQRPVTEASVPEEALAYCALIEAIAPEPRLPPAVPPALTPAQPADVRLHLGGRDRLATPRSVSP